MEKLRLMFYNPIMNLFSMLYKNIFSVIYFLIVLLESYAIASNNVLFAGLMRILLYPIIFLVFFKIEGQPTYKQFFCFAFIFSFISDLIFTVGSPNITDLSNFFNVLSVWFIGVGLYNIEDSDKIINQRICAFIYLLAIFSACILYINYSTLKVKEDLNIFCIILSVISIIFVIYRTLNLPIYDKKQSGFLFYYGIFFLVLGNLANIALNYVNGKTHSFLMVLNVLMYSTYLFLYSNGVERIDEEDYD